MGHTIVGRTAVDSAVANYLHSLLGDEIVVEGWEIVASAGGDVHMLRVHFTTTVAAWPAIFDRLSPHVKGFSAYAAEPGLRVSTALMVNIVDLVKTMAANLETDNRE